MKFKSWLEAIYKTGSAQWLDLTMICFIFVSTCFIFVSTWFFEARSSFSLYSWLGDAPHNTALINSKSSVRYVMVFLISAYMYRIYIY